MKNTFFLLIVMSLNVYGNLISTQSGALTVDDSDEILVSSIQVAAPTRLSFSVDVDGDETGFFDMIIVTNPITGNPGQGSVPQVFPESNSGNIDLLDGITVLPESNTIVLLALGLLVMRMLPRRPPSG